MKQQLTLVLVSTIMVGLVSTLEVGTSGGGLKINVNETELGELISDFKDFGIDYWNQTASERKELCSELKNSYRNTVGKMILNFGNTIAPVAEKWAEIMKYVQVNDECDQECAVKCMNPKKRDTMFFDQACLGACGCQFNAQLADQEELAEDATELSGYVQNLKTFVKERGADAYNTVKPALETYLAKESELYDEFATLVKHHAATAFGCDETCVNDCLNKTWITFYEVPSCLSNCHCSQQLIKLEGGEFNLPSLMKYSGYKLKSWAFFKMHKDSL